MLILIHDTKEINSWESLIYLIYSPVSAITKKKIGAFHLPMAISESASHLLIQIDEVLKYVNRMETGRLRLPPNIDVVR